LLFYKHVTFRILIHVYVCYHIYIIDYCYVLAHPQYQYKNMITWYKHDPTITIVHMLTECFSCSNNSTPLTNVHNFDNIIYTNLTKTRLSTDLLNWLSPYWIYTLPIDFHEILWTDRYIISCCYCCWICILYVYMFEIYILYIVTYPHIHKNMIGINNTILHIRKIL